MRERYKVNTLFVPQEYALFFLFNLFHKSIQFLNLKTLLCLKREIKFYNCHICLLYIKNHASRGNDGRRWGRAGSADPTVGPRIPKISIEFQAFDQRSTLPTTFRPKKDSLSLKQMMKIVTLVLVYCCFLGLLNGNEFIHIYIKELYMVFVFLFFLQ